MTVVTRNLKHKVTYWAYLDSDSYGGFTFSAPVLLDARWQDEATLFQNDNNEEQCSRATVYTDVQIKAGDYLLLGDATVNSTPINVEGAYRVAQHHRTTNLRNLQTIHKVFL